MNDQFPKSEFGHSLARRSAGVSAWVLAGTLDGATLVEIMGVPLIAAAWLSACVVIDRWVMQGTRHT